MSPSEEQVLRHTHCIEACRKAEQFIRSGDWEEALYHLDESRIIASALEREDRLNQEINDIIREKIA